MQNQMKKDAIKSIMNPIRLKIITEITSKGTATTKEIQEVCQDIPQASLYRHIQILLKNGVLKVDSENKVRGMMERVYAINDNPSIELNKRLENVSKQELSELFSLFAVSLLSDMDTYIKNTEKLNLNDKQIRFSSESMYLSNEELIEVSKEINLVMDKRRGNKAENSRKLRKISVVITS